MAEYFSTSFFNQVPLTEQVHFCFNPFSHLHQLCTGLEFSHAFHAELEPKVYFFASSCLNLNMWNWVDGIQFLQLPTIQFSAKNHKAFLLEGPHVVYDSHTTLPIYIISSQNSQRTKTTFCLQSVHLFCAYFSKEYRQYQLSLQTLKAIYFVITAVKCLFNHLALSALRSNQKTYFQSRKSLRAS